MNPKDMRKIRAGRYKRDSKPLAESEKKKLFFDFFFSNSKLLSNKKLADYLRKLKKQIFLNNICLTSILQEPSQL